MIVQDYLDLVTSEYRNSTNFNALISLLVSVPVQVQACLQSMIPLFDLDTPPVGDQLDIIGQWAGISRNVSVPASGIYFTWDGSDPTVGWDFGSWQDPDQPDQIVSLPDDAYLNLIRGKIAANHWNGTTTNLYEVWDAVFPQYTVLIQDNCNMTYAMAITGAIVDSLTVALITGGYIPLRPEGVRITEYLVSTDSNPAFCWDIENATCAGWDTGSWLRELSPT